MIACGGGGPRNAISFIKPPVTIWLFKLCAHVPLIKIKMEFKECTGRNKWSVTALVLSEKKPFQVFLASPQMAQARTPLYPHLAPTLEATLMMEGTDAEGRHFRSSWPAFFLCRMSGLLKNPILSILVYRKPEEVAKVPSKWVWVTHKVSQGPFVEWLIILPWFLK